MAENNTEEEKTDIPAANAPLNEETPQEPQEEGVSAPPQTPKLGRDARVLMISTDSSIFVEGSQARERMRQYSNLFEELHIIVYTLQSERIESEKIQVDRITDNLWVYPTNSISRWLYIWDAYRIAQHELVFGSGFRPDIVSAQDPFETGLAGWLITRKYQKKLQLQVHIDFFAPHFKKENDLNGIRVRIANFLLPKADCVRTVANHITDNIEKKHKILKGRVVTLPVFTDIRHFKDAKATFDLHERYPQFKLILLIASRFAQQKRIDMAINACAPIIAQYPTIGLVIVGDGPLKHQLEKQVKQLGIEKGVVFEPWQQDLTSHFKTADLFLFPSDFEGHGMTLVEALAAGTPIVSTNVGVARDYLEDGFDAFICPIGDAVCFQKKIMQFVNDINIRTSLKINESNVFEKLADVTNIDRYLSRYKAMIEECVLAEIPDKEDVDE